MAIQPFINKPIGGINQNANPNEFPPTDFLDGFDIVDDNPRIKNEKGLLQPCSNTNLAYDLGEATVVRKKYRVSMDLTGLANCNLLINKQVLGLINAQISIPYTSGTDAAATLVLIQNALPDEVINTVTVSGFILIFDIEFINLGYTDYLLTFSNSLGDSYSCVARVDAVSPDKAGVFYPSCFANINNDQQIFATTNTKKPEIFTVTVNTTIVGLRLIFSSDPLIADGEEVFIYSTTGGTGQVSSVCTIQKTTGTTYEVVGVTTTPITASGNYTVIRYYRTLSSIGYATKNDVIDKWKYTELLRTNKFNFRLYKQIQGALDITSDGIIYDWTDFLNTPKRLIYKGEIIENGFLTTYNSEAYYDLDSLAIEGNLQLGANTSKVKLAVASTSASGRTGYVNGDKKEGCYVAFVRFKTQDGAYSTYSKSSNVLWLRSADLREHNSSLNSGRSIQITIEQIPFEIYTYVQVGIIEFKNDSWIGYSLPEQAINGNDTIYISDNGISPESNTSFNDAGFLLEQIPFFFENAKSILAYNNYRLMANVNLYSDYDLTDWAQTITLTQRKKEILIDTETILINPDFTNANIFKGINDYSKCSNEFMSYMPYDHYRYCIFVDWKNGTPTSTYWISDKSFDPSVTGFTNSPTVYVSGSIYYNQLYIEATGINMDYVLPDGKILKDVVKDIRFGRALCSQQVYTAGFGMNAYENPLALGTYYVSGFVDGANTKNDQRLALYSPDFQNPPSSFIYESGDILKTRVATRDSVVSYSTGNQSVTFVNRFLSATTSSVSIDSVEFASASLDSNIARFGYNLGSGAINIRPAAIAKTQAFQIDATTTLSGHLFYYIKPYGLDGAYPLSPQQTRFFVLPQNQWYNEVTHNTSTVYEVYGGDTFPTLSAYKEAENTSDETLNNTAILFYSYNRTNTALRSGRFPSLTVDNYLKTPVLSDAEYDGDRYTYENVFTPRYIFQNQVAFNPLLPQFTNKFSSLYYSGQGFGTDNAGGNRIWLPLDMKTLETKYGGITHFDVLLGQTGTNILIVWQDRRVTAQYFDNTANIKSNTGELLIGNGIPLEREGQNFTEFGCEHKQTIKKGQTSTGKDVAYWLCLRKTAIMRFGADGTSNIIGNIAQLIEEKAILGLFNGYNNDDEPAFFNGIHAVWDNKRMEYILTMRLYPKCIPFAQLEAQKGEFKASPTLKWGFEQFPVIYKSLKDANDDPVTDSSWEKYDSYDSEYFQVLTVVWNENDNTFKSYRSYSPKIYGQFNDNYVSSHPVKGNLIYEHNNILNEALYYAVETKTIITATTDPSTFRINGTGIQSTFPSPFVPYDREKYIVTISGKNYQVIGTGTNYLQMANVDTDDTLPQATIENFSYSVVNGQDPYIITLASNGGGRYFHFAVKEVQADDTLKRTEYEAGYSSLATPTTKSFTNKIEEDFDNGKSNVQIKQDTTNDPTDNEVSLNSVEGMWLKVKNIWRWGKKNRVQTIEIQALETQKTK